MYLCAALVAAASAVVRGEALQSTEAVAGSLAPGEDFEGYTLVAPLPGTLAAVDSLVELNATHGRFPLDGEWPGARFLRAGSFGEAWAATDPRGQPVALKLFYRKDAFGRVEYLRQGMLTTKEQRAVEAAVQECATAQKFITKAAADDPGKRRIVACLQERATGRSHGAPLYLVLEHGGQSVADWLQGEGRLAGLDERRAVVGQLLQGLRLMHENLYEPFIHHDLKPANTVYSGTKRTDDGKKVKKRIGRAKLIDFGATMWAGKANQRAASTATPGYAPPEYLGLGQKKVTFAFPVHSFDIFAMGLIYAEVMCPVVDFAKQLVPLARSPQKSAAQLQQVFPRHCNVPVEDRELIVQMLAWDPTARPSASEILKSSPPFRPGSKARSIIQEPDLLEVSVEEVDDLKASLPAKDEFNPNVREGAALVDPSKGGDMEPLRRCEYKFSEPLLETANFGPGGKRAQCAQTCQQVAQSEHQFVAAVVGPHPLCCMLEMKAVPGGQEFECFWGYGRLVPPYEQGKTTFARPLLLAPKGKPLVRDAKPEAPFDPAKIQWHDNPRYGGGNAGGKAAAPDYAKAAAEWQRDFMPEPQSPRALKRRVSVTVVLGHDGFGVRVRDNPVDGLCKVLLVKPGSLAERARIEVGDQIQKVTHLRPSGTKVAYMDSGAILDALHHLFRPGDTVKFDILRSAPPGARVVAAAKPSGLRQVEGARPQVRKHGEQTGQVGRPNRPIRPDAGAGRPKVRKHVGPLEPFARRAVGRKPPPPEVTVDPAGVPPARVGKWGPETAVLELK